MLETIKKTLRISNDSFDSELLDLIDEAKSDLYALDIDISDEKPLIVSAIKNYCKANFGFRDDGEKWAKKYEQIKLKLMLES